jgi:biotin synthase
MRERPLNFLDPRPGTPFAVLEPLESHQALLTIAASGLALPVPCCASPAGAS